MDLETFWFCLDRRRLGDVLPARGVRLRGRDAAPVRPARRRGAEHGCCGRSARSGTGTRSGSSSPAVRRSPRSRPGTRRCSRASTSRSCSSSFFLIVRVVSFEWRSKSETPGWRCDVDLGEHDRQLRRAAALGDRALVPPVRRPDRLRRRLRGRLLGPLQPVQRVRRDRGRRCSSRSTARRSSRCARRASFASRAERAARRLAIPAAVLRRGLPRLDRRGRDGPQRQGPLPAGAARALGIAALALAVVLPLRRAKRPGLRDDRARSDRRSSRRCSRASTRA